MELIINTKDLPSRGRCYPKDITIKVKAVPFFKLIQLSKLNIQSLQDIVSVYGEWINLSHNMGLQDLEKDDLTVLVSYVTVLSDSREGYVPNIECQHIVDNPEINFLSSLIVTEKDSDLVESYKAKLQNLPKTIICGQLLVEPIAVTDFSFTETTMVNSIKRDNFHTLYPPIVSRIIEVEDEGYEPEDLLYPFLIATKDPINEVEQSVQKLLKDEYLSILNDIESFIVNLNPIPIVCPKCNNTTRVVFKLNQLRGYL